MVGLVSAVGLIGFLSEPDPELRVFALKQLDAQVDLLWTEIAGSVGQMYGLLDNSYIRGADLTSLVKRYMKMKISQSEILPRLWPRKSTTTFKSTMRAWHSH